MVDIDKEFPFKRNYFFYKGHRFHYVDEGQGPVLLCLHGNPTWSYFYRNVIHHFKNKFRVIVLDHIGHGLSSMPQDYEYNLKNHGDNLDVFLKVLLGPNKNFHLLVHDWGGAIGAYLLWKRQMSPLSWSIMNTAAFISKDIPKRIAFCRTSIGEYLVRKANAFAWPATFMAVTKPLKKSIRDMYLYPYQNSESRVSIAKFVRDIPMEQEHPTYKVLKNIEAYLPEVDCPKLLLWGERDFCFHKGFLQRWQDIYPNANVCTLNAGHYILEDSLNECLSSLSQFLGKKNECSLSH